MPVQKICEVCSTPFSVPPVRRDTAKTCSRKCKGILHSRDTRGDHVTIRCKNCGEEFEEFPSHAGRRIYCSKECQYTSTDFLALKSKSVSGSNNPMWRGGESQHSDGYTYIRSVAHPFSSNGYVFKHRLIVEEWLREVDPDNKFLIEIDGIKYLIPGIDVHHLDEIKTNNDRSNLVVCTKQAHGFIHNTGSAPAGTFWPEDTKFDIRKSRRSKRFAAYRDRRNEIEKQSQ